MRYFPMFLEMRGRDVLLAGGGEQIAQKARLLRRTEAHLTVMAADLNEELSDLVADGVADRIAEDFSSSAIARADFAFIGVDDQTLASRIAAAARSAGALVNVIDKPDDCDMITPALVDRDPVVIAIGTEGAAPVLARRIKTGLEATLSPRLGAYIAHLQSLRPAIADAVSWDQRLPFWRWAVNGAPWSMWDEGDEENARAALTDAIAGGRPPEAAAPRLSIIQSPRETDLASLRAVRRLQEAALVIHPSGADETFLDLARRDADRMALSVCPRHALGDVSKAVTAEDGNIAIVVPNECGAGVDAFEMRGAERINAGFASS